MEFFKGLFTVSLFYVLVWATFQIGYAKGKDSLERMRSVANIRLSACHKVIGANND